MPLSLGECYDCGKQFKKKTLEILIDNRQRTYHKRCAKRYARAVHRVTYPPLSFVRACVFPHLVFWMRTPVMFKKDDDVYSIYSIDNRMRIIGEVCDALGRL